ncbi:hypothetical protein pb186bvf_014262 [Paramecium bursaria]
MISCSYQIEHFKIIKKMFKFFFKTHLDYIKITLSNSTDMLLSTTVFHQF